jgi:uncharacterized protein (TIGR03382 family)
MRTLLLSSLLLAHVAAAQVVPWSVETSFVGSSQAGDPAVVSELGTARILGTDAVQNGLYSWTFDGGFPTELLSLGILRSVDAVPGLITVASANGVLLFFELTPTGLVARDPMAYNATSPGVVSLARVSDGGYEAWFDTTSTTIEHLSIRVEANRRLAITALPSITVPQPPSGLVVDARTRRLYVAQPTLGIYAVNADGGGEFVVSIDAGTLGPILGGVSLFHAVNGGAVLFSTSPNEDRVQLHELSGGTTASIGSFEVGEPDGGAVRVRSPRHLDVHELPLSGFPLGVLVVQDGVGGNYKVVDLAAVSAAVALPPADGISAPTPDAGTVDAGVDGGSGTVIGGGGGGTIGGGGSTQPPITEGCSCTSSPLALLPAVLLLWWIRRFRP